MRKLLPVVGIALTVTVAAQTPKPTFEVASVKRRVSQGPPSGPPVVATRTGAGAFYRRSESLSRLVQFAYNVSSLQVSGGPEWVRRDSFEIDARAAANASLDQMRLMVQSLLEERFTLIVRTERQEMPHYILTLDKVGAIGPTLRTCDDFDKPSPSKPVRVPPGATMPIVGNCTSVSSLASAATGVMGRPVIDRTGLTGTWNYELVFSDGRELTGREKELAALESVPVFPLALREQLGLRLESGRGPIDVIVIQSVEPPTEN